MGNQGDERKQRRGGEDCIQGLNRGARLHEARATRRRHLRLAVQLADEVFSSPVLVDGQRFQIYFHLTPRERSVRFTEPERRELRDLLGVIRKFDMPTHNVRMRRLHEIVERVGVNPDWREGLEQAKAAYEARNELTGIQVQVPDEPPTESPT